MSLYGNDCHFFYNSVCMKGSSCPFRHCEAAKVSNVTCQFWKQNKCIKPSCSFRHADIAVTKNRAEIPCYWETQPSGCAKSDCPFKHINSKGGKNTEQNSASVDEKLAAGDVEGNAQQSFVVNLAEDSDMEMASPEKRLPKEIGTTEAKNGNKQGNVTSSVIVKKQPAATTLKKREPSVVHTKRLIVHPDVSHKQSVAAKILTSNKTHTHPVTSQKIHIEAKKQTSNKVSIKNRLTLKSSENEMEEPVKRIPVKDRLKLGSAEQKKSVKERLYVKNETETRVSKSEETLRSDGDEEEEDSDGEVEVKSLEQIQREKALRSMGLIELKNGKLIKISELEKSKGTEEKGESDEESEEEGEEKQEEEEQGHEEEEEEEDEEDVESSKEEESSNEPEEEEVEEEEFEDPEIELSAPDDEFEEEIENTRLTVKKVLVKADTKKKKKSQVVEDKHVKGRRIVLADDGGADNDTPDLKATLRKRLGRRVQSTENSAGEKPQVPAIKRRLGMIGSSNEGTIKTVKGIKSRLGYKAEQQEEEHNVGDAREKLKLKKKRELQTRDSDGEEIGGVVRVITGSEEKPVKKRGWRKTKIIIQKVEDSSDSESSTAETPQLPVQTAESLKSKVSPQKTSVFPQKSTVPETKKIRKEEDSGTKLQNMFTQKWRNTIWSNRNQKAKSVNSRLDELGIGIIDIKGGKVVKMGATDEDKESKQKKEDKLVNHLISHETKKEPKKNQRIYVPPAMKRQTADDQDTENRMTARKRGRITYTEEKSDSEEDSSSDIHVKTFAEIMSAKQKQEKGKSKVKETKLEEPAVTYVQDLSEDSNEVPSESAVYNIAKMITGSLNKVANKTSDSQSSKHHKKKSRWRKKRKSSQEKGEKSLKRKHSSEIVVETSNLETESSQETADTVNVNQTEVFCTAPEISLPAADQSQNEIQSPKKRSDQLLSDSWLDLVDDEDGSGVATQDDDDLLREIDELLA